ncbi:MAG: M1 family metallopeptidase, partial [Actinomycetota bacterium]|nr:M1 family metallopeptidase [Actinomycetota bacterium]
MPATDAHRLPRSVSPEHYDLTFAISLGEGTFTGEERVTVLVHEPTDELVLHAAALDIGHAALAAEGDRHPPRPARAVLDADDERVTFRLDEAVAPGSYVLHVAFSGTLGDKLHGIYRSTFTDGDGRSHAIAATQFEPTDARRAFPCWDEPDRKATFSTTLVVADGLTAVSNTPIVATAALGDGRTRVDFAPTIRMSTYLVAFVVGPLEATDPVDVEGVTLRVVCVPGKRHLAGFALEIGAHALRYFAEYFGVAYPAAKLDLIALPDFAMGAMENLGAVTFRETLLLVDPQRASRVELERVADVVSHEVAHMWFGDLVTMRWWNGIWLNEAFATFMEMLCVDDFRPEWERWVSFGTSRDGAMAVDGLAATRPIEFPVRRPEEAEAMFDVLTYEKGAAVVRMLERYVGHDAFRRGIRSYIAEHRYANTETSDLWDAVERATGEPARSTMDSWIFQGGFPVVSAALAADGRSVVLSQRRFRYRVPEAVDAAVWGVPMVLRGSAGGRPVRRRVLLDGAGTTVDLGGPVEWVMANEGAWGFFRVRYDAELRARLLGDLSRLDALERLALVGDTWAGVLAAEAPLAELLDLAVLLVGEDDPSVWHQLLDAVVELDRVASDEDRPALQAFVRRLAGPALARVGWS